MEPKKHYVKAKGYIQDIMSTNSSAGLYSSKLFPTPAQFAVLVRELIEDLRIVYRCMAKIA